MRRYASAVPVAAAGLLALAPVALAQAAPEADRNPESLGALFGALLAAAATLLLSLALAMWAVKIAISLYDRWTKDIDELAEIQKGNVAVGLLMAAVIYSVASIITSGVVALTEAIKPQPDWKQYAIGVIVGVINLLVSLALATFAVNMAMKFLNKFTKDVDELKEVGKGNVAVALLMAGVLISVSSVVQAGVAGIARILEAERVAKALGL